MNQSKKFYILDGYSLIYRSYFAFIRNPLFSPDGRNSSAVFGFFRTLLSFLGSRNAQYYCVALDPKKPGFRHQKYPEYKANREKAPDDLHAQVPVIEAILEAMQIPVARVEGYEADDIMATYTSICQKAGFECVVITGDKDLLQLVDKGARYLKPDKSGYLEMTPELIYSEWGVRSSQILDFLSLTGDSSDNVPGVPGIGPKSAASLLGEYDSLEGIYDNLDKLTAAQRSKLENGRDSAWLSRDLIQLVYDVPGLPEPEHYRLKDFDQKAVEELFLKEGARSLVQQLRAMGEGRPLDQVPAAASAVRPVIDDDWEVDDQPGSYSAVLESGQLEEMLRIIHQHKSVAFDIETDALDPMQARPVGFSFSCSQARAWYLPLSSPDAKCLDSEVVKKALTDLFSDTELKIIGQNIKYDYKVLKRWGIDIGALIHFDTMVAAWVLDTSANVYNMDQLAERHLGYKTVSYDQVVEKGKGFETVPLESALHYAAEDADITFRLYSCYRKKLAESGMAELFYNIEMPLVRILGDMELAGIGIDSDRLRSYGQELGKDLGVIEKEIYSLCGREFNINSPKQLQEILFVERKLTPVKKTKTGYSTDVGVLEALASEDPVPEKILLHRSLSKLKSTYVDVLPDMLDSGDQRLHTSFNLTGTATGRLSSTNPNLQNIPIKSGPGRKIRDAFIPGNGTVFLSADYSQIELVVFAHLSDDPGLKKAFIEGSDVHAMTAALIFDLPLEMVMPEQRRIAKTINFGVIYGMSAFRLANELKIPRKHAAAFIDSYFERYPRVRDFMERVIKETEETGYSTTFSGRRRTIPGISSRNKTEKMSAERIAVNTPVQGSAADIVKMAMIALDRELKQRKLDSRLILQVHDELIFEVPEAEIEEMKSLVRKVMEGTVKLDVPLKVSIETGSSWGQLH